MSYRFDFQSPEALAQVSSKWKRADGQLVHLDTRLDAGENYFFLRELTAIEARWFEMKHAPRDARRFVPTYTDGIGPETESYLYRMSDSLGRAKKIITASGDVPLVNVRAVEASQRFQSYGLGMEYTLDEIQAAARLNRPLERDRAMQVRRGIDQLMDDIVTEGDSSSGLAGFGLLSGTSTYTLSTKAATGTKWLDASTGAANATPDEIIRDLNAMLTKVRVDTHMAESPRRILLSPKLYEHIANTPRATISDTTILKFFLDTHPGIEVMEWERLQDLTGYNNRIIAYDPNPDNVCLLMSIEFDMQPPEKRNFAWYVPCRTKTGGVISRYPKSIIYADGAIA